MKLIVGLGNPGPKYARNRHNIGFMVLDQIASDHGAPAWRGKHQGSVTEARFGAERAVLLKPETFMNKSGDSVGAAMRFYKLGPEDVIVFHDEIDLAPGKVRWKMGGGHAGHNGLRSIHAHIGEGYGRVRLGVGHPGRKEAVPAYVLHDFPKADDDWLDDVLRGCSDGVAHLLSGDSGKFMNAVSLRTAPARSSKTSSKADGKSAGKTSAKTQAEAAKPAPEPPEPLAPDTRNPLQRLVDRFR